VKPDDTIVAECDGRVFSGPIAEIMLGLADEVTQNLKVFYMRHEQAAAAREEEPRCGTPYLEES
jgi:hypothetical protein